MAVELFFDTERLYLTGSGHVYASASSSFGALDSGHNSHLCAANHSASNGNGSPRPRLESEGLEGLLSSSRASCSSRSLALQHLKLPASSEMSHMGRSSAGWRASSSKPHPDGLSFGAWLDNPYASIFDRKANPVVARPRLAMLEELLNGFKVRNPRGESTGTSPQSTGTPTRIIARRSPPLARPFSIVAIPNAGNGGAGLLCRFWDRDAQTCSALSEL